MKKDILILVLLGLTLTNVSSQYYQTVTSDRIACFETLSKDVNCIRIDSVFFETDSLFYPHSNIQKIDFDCYTPYGASWIGEKIVVQENGYNLFFNHELDTIKIKTNAQLNESWIAYELEDSIYVTAEITAHDTREVLGHTDSVKTIVFNVYDKNNTPIDHELNGISVLLSKSFGWLKTLEFYHFPYPKVHNLIGVSQPEAGVGNLTWLDVHDYQVGDEIHVLYQKLIWGDDDYSIQDTWKTIYKYLERENHQDSVVYVIDVKESRKREWLPSDSIVTTYTRDTIIQVVKPDSLFDKLPGEPIINIPENSQNAYVYQMKNYSRTQKILPSMHGILYFSSDDCWNYPTADGCVLDKGYIQGLGGPYYHCEWWFDSYNRELVYYKKGDEIWGTPLIVTGIQEEYQVDHVVVYPNPGSGNFWIKHSINEPLTFELMDLHGKVLITEKLETNKHFLDLNNFNSGIYIYQLRNHTSIVEKGKLIIK